MEAELLHMSQQEQSRSGIIRLYVEGYIKQKEAARRMGLSTRQVRRLARGYRLHGSSALIHGNRGKEVTVRSYGDSLLNTLNYHRVPIFLRGNEKILLSFRA